MSCEVDEKQAQRRGIYPMNYEISRCDNACAVAKSHGPSLLETRGCCQLEFPTVSTSAHREIFGAIDRPIQALKPDSLLQKK